MPVKLKTEDSNFLKYQKGRAYIFISTILLNLINKIKLSIAENN